MLLLCAISLSGSTSLHIYNTILASQWLCEFPTKVSLSSLNNRDTSTKRCLALAGSLQHLLFLARFQTLPLRTHHSKAIMAPIGKRTPKRASQRQAEKRRVRTLGQLDIAGQPRQGETYKSGGGYWVDVEGEEPAVRSKPSKKRKRTEEPAADDDQAFLQDAQRQLKRVNSKASRRMRQYLNVVEAPAGEQDAQSLSVDEARQLLQSTAAVETPIFVTSDNSNASFLDPGSDRRPIEQVFDWLTDPDEQLHDGQTSPTVAEVRERFLADDDDDNDNGVPWNLPDIPFPFHVPSIPSFVQTVGCNLLGDIMRHLLDVSPNNICPDSCKDRPEAGKCCKAHFLTTEEFGELQQGWRMWQCTVMLAEAGALTDVHHDKWGFGTWISCVEGEIGFAWLSRPTTDELDNAFSENSKPEGRWLYKVLRPNDSLYMAPGTPHTVFRLPEGKQTLALAGHVLRRCDLERWLKFLLRESELAKKEDDEGEVALGLVEGVRHLLKRVKGNEDLQARYGGVKSVARAEKLLLKIEKKCQSKQ